MTTLMTTEKLIVEVQKRPCIWNVHHPSYTDKHLKMKAWQKICRIFFPQTAEHSADETNKVTFIQKKWKSVRDYYTKQRKEIPSGSRDDVTFAKRRKYIHFDMLRFLENNVGMKSSRFDLIDETSTGEKEVASPVNSLDLHEDSEETLIKEEDLEDFRNDESEFNPNQQQTSFKFQQDLDEDELFLLSLLPSIRKLTPLQKIDFKLATMNALKTIQFSNFDD